MAKKKQKDPAAQALGRRGGKARAKKLTPGERAESARKAALMRWQKLRDEQEGSDGEQD